ncbi:MAG TPA: cytochrome c1 [Gemmatimonadales bacterium]|jgi:ubiquinol-cytochrome c reductase cytochrome c1 subunit|nr:cytochrome c1 [Gemmatimonadales bacterium]
MKTTRSLAGIILFAAAGIALAEGGAPLLPAPGVSRFELDASLQRGARNFANYCLNCHSAQYMRYNRLTDLGLSEEQIQDNLMFATDKIGGTMTVAMTRSDATTWLGAAPPDLSVEARVRGRDWLYSYLLAFYRDDKTATGWNNLVFPNVAMPHVLWNLSGTQKLVETQYEDQDKAEAAAIAAKSLALAEPAGGGKYVVKTLAESTPGTLSHVEYEKFVSDLVNYLDYISEPVKNDRINIGIAVLIFLGVLFALVYSLKRDYWKEVH